jgi:hypothetical protein
MKVFYGNQESLAVQSKNQMISAANLLPPTGKIFASLSAFWREKTLPFANPNDES